MKVTCNILMMLDLLTTLHIKTVGNVVCVCVWWPGGVGGLFVTLEFAGSYRC
jgi:hypothetical protein